LAEVLLLPDDWHWKQDSARASTRISRNLSVSDMLAFYRFCAVCAFYG